MRRRIQITFRKSFFLLLPLIASSLVSFNTAHLHGINLLEKTFIINKSITSISLTMLMKEKVNNVYIHKKADFKIAYNPYNFYLKQLYPNEGLEILYLEGQNDNKAIVNRNSLTLSVLQLDPIGNPIRKNHHHSIFKAGISFMLDIFENLYNKYDPNDSSIWKYNGLVKYAGIVCHKITFESPEFTYIPYEVKKGETLESLSRKLFISDYMVYERNPSIKSFESIKAGTTIKVPNDYGKKIILYIERNQCIPVGVKIFDDSELYEEYTYLNVKVNPQFQTQDFDINNPAYGFN